MEDIKICINRKEVSLKEILDILYKIYLICSDNCKYCIEHNIKTDKEKLELIKKLIRGLGYE